MPNVAAIKGRCLLRLRFAVTRSCTPESRKMSSNTMDAAKAMRLISTDSANSPLRNEPVVAPNTFCVLMLLMRIGVSARVKFMKLMAATMIIRNDTQMSR